MPAGMVIQKGVIALVLGQTVLALLTTLKSSHFALYLSHHYRWAFEIKNIFDTQNCISKKILLMFYTQNCISKKFLLMF